MSATSSGASARSCRFTYCLATALALAAVLPACWLIGNPGPDDPMRLRFGVSIWRAAFGALAAFLVLSCRFSPAARPSQQPARVLPRALLVVLIAATVLRVYRLGAPLWFDEIWMVLEFVRRPLRELIHAYPTDNNHPLYSLLASVSASLFGETPFAIRIPAAAFGVGSVWALFVFGRRWIGRTEGLLAAALLAISFHHIGFSQNARGYSALLFFALLSSHFLLACLETRRRRDWMLYGVTTAFGIYTHLTGAFIVIGHLAVLLGYGLTRRDANGRAGLVAGGLGVVFGGLLAVAMNALILPQIFYFFFERPDRVHVSSEWTSPLWLAAEAARSFGVGLVPGIMLLSCGLVVFFTGLWATARRRPSVAALLLAPAALLSLMLIGLGRNLWPRFYFFLAGFGLLVIVTGAMVLARSGFALLLHRGDPITRQRSDRAAATALILLSLLLLPRAYQAPKQDFPAAARWVRSAVKATGMELPIVTVGLATYPYRDYYREGFGEAETLEDLLAAVPKGSTGYVIYTFPIYLESRQPELWEYLQRSAVEVHRCPASVGGGDLVVLRLAR